MAKKKAVARLKAGTAVRWCGASGKWTVIEWQPHNGTNGSYWLKNSRGVSATAAPDEVKEIGAIVKNKAGKPASVLPGVPDNFVVMGLSTAENKKVAEAIRKKLAGDTEKPGR